jgi:hypothetical protein
MNKQLWKDIKSCFCALACLATFCFQTLIDVICIKWDELKYRIKNKRGKKV